MKNSDQTDEIRLNRYLAQCGIGSRRKADELILSGSIFVNGTRVTELGSKVKPGKDKVEFRGKEVRPFHRLQYLAYHKPRGVVVTKNDPEKRETIYDEFRKKGYNLDYLNYVGRLDFNSEGLLLMTNDGDLIHALTHPRFQIKKVYTVKIDRRLTSQERQKLIDGIESEGQVLHAGDVREISPAVTDQRQFWYEIDLFEGKNRQIRRMLEALGIQVSRLRRIQFGTVRLGELKSGELRELSLREIGGLKNTGYKSKK